MSVILHQWHHVQTTLDRVAVLPDGCRDLIFWQDKDGRGCWKFSALQAAPMEVPIGKGTQLTGFRLKPGAYVSSDLLRALPDHPNGAAELIEAAVEGETRSAEAIIALSQCQSVAEAARFCGVTERTFHRRVGRETGFAPVFWHRLARVRRAALHIDDPLIEVALECGFSDQPHMSREFKRWLGISPRKLRRRYDLRDQLSEPALATGEQISMR